MRPQSIQNFDRFYLSAVGLGLLNSVFSFKDTQARIAENPASAQLGSGFLIVTVAFSIGISLLLWYLISRRASNIAKWILVVLTAIGLLFLIPSLSSLMEGGVFQGLFTLVVNALNLVAVWFLFKPDAKAWLESKGQHGSVDSNLFN